MEKEVRKGFDVGTLTLHERRDGYYLYDTIIGMNIVMRASSEVNAYIEAALYYQKESIKVKSDFNELNDKVLDFVTQFISEEDSISY